MIVHNIDPVAFRIGTFEVHWYGLMYLIGFTAGWFLARYRARRPGSCWTVPQVDDLLTLSMIGVILGGRLGYILFYDLSSYIENPIEIFKIWHGGMSFHGGLLGVICAFFYFSRSRNRSFWQVSDFVSPLVPQALMWGRLGNFINGELWGKPSEIPWAIIFQRADHLTRHPSQLYEAFFEGLILFIVLWVYSSKRHPPGRVSGFFALGYGIARFACEFVRVPDAHIGYLAFGWLTMGQLLCLPLIGVGIWLLARKTGESC